MKTKHIREKGKSLFDYFAAVVSLTSGFSRSGWSNDGQFNREGWGGLGLPKVLQRVEHECVTVLLRFKEVDILIEDYRVCGIQRPLQRLDQVYLLVFLWKREEWTDNMLHSSYNFYQ